MTCISIFLILSISIDLAMTSAPFSSALVLYSPDTAPLARFKESSRRVTVGSNPTTTVILEQSWNEYGVAGVLWDSATVLTNYLLSNHAAIDFKGKSILELGSGLGLPSIALSLLSSASTIIATEQVKGLPLLKRNVAANNSTVEVVELDWISPSSSSICSHQFDFIFGADLVYKEEAFEPLISTVHFFATVETVIYLASKIRYPKDRKFYRNLALRGFNVKKVVYDRDTDVYVYIARRIPKDL